MTTTNQYDLLNRLTGVGSVTNGNNLAVRAAYQYNLASQRATNTAADDTYWAYQYDNLGQITNAVRHWPNNGSPIPGQQFTYGFDTIGNRLNSGVGGNAAGTTLRTNTYTANPLNQYAAQSNSSYVTLSGTADNNALVYIAGQLANRTNNYFWKELQFNNAGPLWTNISVAAFTLTNNTPTNVAIASGNKYIAQANISPAYDADGNLTNDSHWAYAWDAENRLIGMTNISGAGLERTTAI